MQKMAMNPIDVYLHEHLAPQLAAYSLVGEHAAVLLEDVRARLASVVCRWHDVDFRRTILHIGMEEGYFYDPVGCKNLIRVDTGKRLS